MQVCGPGHEAFSQIPDGELTLELELRFCVVVFPGYDSDVAREKVVDYVTKIYSTSIRNMSGTKPHLQHKELPAEERYHTDQNNKFSQLLCNFSAFAPSVSPSPP